MEEYKVMTPEQEAEIFGYIVNMIRGNFDREQFATAEQNLRANGYLEAAGYTYEEMWTLLEDCGLDMNGILDCVDDYGMGMHETTLCVLDILIDGNLFDDTEDEPTVTPDSEDGGQGNGDNDSDDNGGNEGNSADNGDDGTDDNAGSEGDGADDNTDNSDNNSDAGSNTGSEGNEVDPEGDVERGDTGNAQGGNPAQDDTEETEPADGGNGAGADSGDEGDADDGAGFASGDGNGADGETEGTVQDGTQDDIDKIVSDVLGESGLTGDELVEIVEEQVPLVSDPGLAANADSGNGMKKGWMLWWFFLLLLLIAILVGRAAYKKLESKAQETEE